MGIDRRIEVDRRERQSWRGRKREGELRDFSGKQPQRSRHSIESWHVAVACDRKTATMLLLMTSTSYAFWWWRCVSDWSRNSHGNPIDYEAIKSIARGNPESGICLCDSFWGLDWIWMEWMHTDFFQICFWVSSTFPYKNTHGYKSSCV